MSGDGGGGAPIIGGIFNAGGNLMESSDKAQAYENQANDLRRNATLTRQMGTYNAMRQQIMAGKKFGAISTDYAASGIASDSGSALAVLAASHINSEFDRLSILHGSELHATMMEERANYDMDAADRTKQMGYYNAFASIFGGAARAGAMSGPDDTSGGDKNDYSSSDGGGYGTAGGRTLDGDMYA